MFASCLRQSIIMNEVSESRPEVGSSRMSTEGLLSSSKAIEVRLRYPPEIPLRIWPPTITSKHFYNFNFQARKLILSFFSYWLPLILRSAANFKVSLTVRVCIRISCCITQLPKLPNFSDLQEALFAMSSPQKYEEVILPARILSRVVLPEPEGPMIAESEPAGNIPVTLFSMYFSVSLILQVIFLNDISTLS